MSESKEQFRERIGRVLTTADGGDWDAMNESFREDYSGWAEAVYAEALRDVYAEARRVALPYMGAGSVYRHIEQFAAERGIDLDE